MNGILLGLETEYAFAIRSESDVRLSRRALLLELLQLVKSRHPHVRDGRAPGVYLENGSRLYIDAGMHPELSTPECPSPLEVVRYALAGERILDTAATELEAQHPGTKVMLFRCNVDYSGQRTTWGCHESYLYTADPKTVLPNIVPHLVSRVVYTGAGGFNSVESPMRYTVSPRVAHLVKVKSDESTTQRGIFHTKDEPLCVGPYHRLHVLCGESLCSQLANYLKLGTTSLIMRLLDAGIETGRTLAMRAPLTAMRTFAEDARCRSKAQISRTVRRTAVEIQRRYLEMVEERLGSSILPEWAPQLCRVWRQTLERLELDPDALAGALDWPTKRALFASHLAHRGSSWPQVGADPALDAELCEIDMRFGQLGAAGIFNALDADGALSHHVAGLGSVEEARRDPPAGGRAQARGHAIRELHDKGADIVGHWAEIADPHGHRLLDMSDPFGPDPSWQDAPNLRVRPSLEGLLAHDPIDEPFRSRASGRSNVPVSFSADDPFGRNDPFEEDVPF